MPGWLKAFSVAMWTLTVIGCLIAAAIIYSIAAELSGGNTVLTLLLTLVGAAIVVGFLAWVVRIQETESKTAAETATALGLHRIADDFINTLWRQARTARIDPEAVAAAEDVVGDIGAIRIASKFREVIAGERVEEGEISAAMKGQIERMGKPLPQHRFFLLDWPQRWFRELFWGTRHGNVLRVFHYTQGGSPTRTFSCVMTEIDAVPSPVVIARGNVGFRPDLLTPPRQVSGDAPFDRTFGVYARNAEVSKPVFDARVRRWLLESAPPRVAFELNGDRLLCRADVRSGPKLVELVDKAEEFTLILRSVV